MPKSTPIGAYPSKSAAVIDLFFNQNKPVREIAAFVQQSESNITATIATERARRRRKDMSPWQRERAMRILPQIFDVVAEALGTRRSALIQFIKHTTFPSAAPSSADVSGSSPIAADTPASVDDTTSIVSTGADLSRSDVSTPPDASAVGGGEEPEPDPADHQLPNAETDVLRMKPATQATWDEKVSTGLVTLKDPVSGLYLNLDGSALTADRRYIYRGSIAQARTMRAKNPIAKGLSFRTFSAPKS